MNMYLFVLKLICFKQINGFRYDYFSFFFCKYEMPLLMEIANNNK